MGKEKEMITVRELKRTINGKEIADIVCLSTDVKPTGLANGSICLEMNTGKFYVYDEENNEWKEQE
jgi:hypothetical protein